MTGRERRVHEPRSFRRASMITAATILGLSMVAGAQTAKYYALETLDGLRPYNVTTVPATLGGRKGVRVNATDEIRRRMRAMTPVSYTHLTLPTNREV